MISYFLNTVKPVAKVLAVLLIFGSCQKDPSQIQFEIGSDLIDGESKVSICDTFSIELSTVQNDSLITSGYDEMLVGDLSENNLGRVNSKCYFRLSLPTTAPFFEGDIFDSISMIVKLNGYSFGDTLKKQTWNIYRLSQALEKQSNGYLYNTSSFSRYEDPLGSLSFKPYPAMKQKVEIPLDKVFGNYLFNLYVNKDQIIETTTSFQEFLKGFVIETDGNGTNSILGISTKDTSIMMRLYAHRVAEEKKNVKLDFAIETGNMCFSEITHDRQNSQLTGLLTQKNKIASSLTGNQSFVQGGAGLMTRIDIPSLSKIIEMQNTLIVKAELILRPVFGTYQLSRLPTQLIYSKGDKYNNAIETYINSETKAREYGTLNKGNDLYNENTYYLLDITSYIKDELSDNYFNPGTSSILVYYNNPDYNSSLSSITFGDCLNKNQKSKLKLYLIHY